jgi:ParB family chromosome partitioning protein
MGHARALLSLTNRRQQVEVGALVAKKGLSVRDTEALVKRLSGPAPAKAARAQAPGNDVHTRAAEDRMRFALGAKVKIVRRGSGGAIEIAFESETELNRLYEHLTAKS